MSVGNINIFNLQNLKNISLAFRQYIDVRYYEI